MSTEPRQDERIEVAAKAMWDMEYSWPWERNPRKEFMRERAAAAVAALDLRAASVGVQDPEVPPRDAISALQHVVGCTVPDDEKCDDCAEAARIAWNYRAPISAAVPSDTPTPPEA